MNKKIVSGVILSLLLVNIATVTFDVCRFSEAVEQDTDWWPMYRHDPQHTSYSTSKAPNANHTLWIRQFGDWVRSSPTIHNNRVFIGADDGASGGRVYALNAATGEQIWNHTTGGDVVSSTAVAYGRIYFGSYDRKFYCLLETNGYLLWRFSTGGTISSSPCVMENKVVFGSNDFKIYCLDATTGDHLWNFSTLGEVWSSPAIVDGKVIFGSLDAKVYALNLTNGTLIWSTTTDSSINGSPSIADNKVFMCSSKRVYCLDATNGHLIWSYTTGGTINSSPAITNDNVFIGCNDYKMYCINAVDGQLKWTFTTGDIIYSSPAVADGKVFFGSNDQKVYCLSTSTGTLIWSYNTGGKIKTSSPGIAQRLVYIATNYYPPFSGKLFAFGRLTNTPPVATNLTITPPSPVTTDNLIGSYQYYDDDGDPEDGTEIRWYKNGTLQPEYNDTLEISFGSTTKGEKWNFTAKPKDGIDFGDPQISSVVTIQNTPPSIEQVIITPNPAYTNDTLIANPNGWLDIDGDSEGYSYQWQKYDDVVGWQNVTGATNENLSHDHFVKTDSIKILCIPYDGENYGDAKEDTIVISNAPPVINSYYPLVDPTIAEGESQEFNVTKFDVDADSLTVAWWKNQSHTGETSDFYLFTADYESAGIYNVTVIVSDSLSQVSHHWWLAVIDLEHDVAITNITLFRNIVGEGTTLSFNIKITNQGELTEIFNITAYANTTTIATVTNATLTSGNSTTVTFMWNTTGVAKGNYIISAFATPVPGETDMTDNTLTDGIVIITFPGDVNGDRKVRIDDILAIALAFGLDLGDPDYDPNLDVNGDDKIRIDDILIAALNFGQG